MSDIKFSGTDSFSYAELLRSTTAHCPTHGEVGGDFRVYVTGDSSYSTPKICPKCYVDWVAANVTAIGPVPEEHSMTHDNNTETPSWDVVVKTGEQHFDAYGVTIRWTAFSHRLEFQAQRGDRQPDGSICYMHFPEGGGANTPTDDFAVAAADRYIAGTITCVGCSHLSFGEGEQNPGYMHLCGAGDVRTLAVTIAEAFRIAAAEVPSFDASVAELASLSAGRISP